MAGRVVVLDDPFLLITLMIIPPSVLLMSDKGQRGRREWQE